MKIIISPAKKMHINTDVFEAKGIPKLLEYTKEILSRLQEMDYAQLKMLWSCNNEIAKNSFDMLRKINLETSVTPAILAYEGIQYKYMSPSVFNDEEFAYIDKHLRILSGFYGILSPFDGVSPYRLEMQSKLGVAHGKNLYDFWGDAIAKQLLIDTDFILNLASKEYSKAVSPYIPKSIPFITCTFGQIVGDKITEKGTMCKMARGEMVRYLAEHNITTPNLVKDFSLSGYAYSQLHSTDNNYVFLKK